MYDSFDMACHDASSALRLNIKVNSENLLPNSQKYNVGSLRLPADPSWPKIPQRRLADDSDGIIEPPCVITLTGTPRKNRTTIRPSRYHQSAKPSFSKDQVPVSFHRTYHKDPPTTHILKRRPGCADPRFKRVTTVKSQVTSNDAPDRENHTEVSRSAVIIPNQVQCSNENVRKSVPEKDPPKVTQQEAEKPGEIRGMDSIGIQTMSIEESATVDDGRSHAIDAEVSKGCRDLKKISEDVGATERHKISPREIGDCKIFQQNSTDESKPLIHSESYEGHGDGEPSPRIVNSSKLDDPASNLTIVSNTPINVHSESTSLPYCQGNAGKFFLVVENKAQASSLNALQIDPSPVPSCQYTTQCYNVQVPVLTYQNLPLQISTQTPAKVDIPSQLSLSPVLTIPSTPSLKNPTANLSFDNPAVNCSRPSAEVPDIKVAVPNSDTADKSAAHVPQPEVYSEDTKNNCNPIRCQDENRDKYLISSDVATQQAGQSLGTPPIKLGRKYEDNYKREDVRIEQLLSDTTDSELYSVEAKETNVKGGCIYTKEVISCSGSDCDLHFHRQSKFKNDLQQLKKKRRKPICSSTGTSRGILCAGNYEDRCPRNPESSMGEEESTRPRAAADDKQKSRSQRKMKSEQNLPRYLPFGGRNYKNISDPHLAVRESYRVDEEVAYPSSYPNTRHKRECRYRKDVQTTETTTDVDSNAMNTHRTDVSNNEESKKPGDTMLPDKRTSALPARTQQLLNKSYMEYYDKLRSGNIDGSESAHQNRHVCQMAMGAPQLKKRRAEINAQVTKIYEQKESIPEALTLEKCSALSNIINRNLNTTLKHSSDAMRTTHLYVNENMKSSSDPTAGTESAVLRKVAGGESADLYDSSVPSSTLIDRVTRKRVKPLERRLLKLKTIAFFGLMMYAVIVLLPLMYNFFLYDEYEDYEDLSYIELTLDYVVSSFREAFGGLFDAISDLLFQPFFMIFSVPVENVTTLL